MAQTSQISTAQSQYQLKRYQSCEEADQRYDLALKRHNDLTQDRVHGIFLNAFSTSLDPHSSYMPAEELEDFRIRTELSLEGIGASLI